LTCQFYDGSIPMSLFFSTEPNRLAICFTLNHHPQYRKQFIVIIITTQHTYYYNHSSPSHWPFSFALSFHFIPLFGCHIWTQYSTLGVFFRNQSSAAIALIFDRTNFSFLVLNITTQFATLHKHHYWYITSEKFSYSFN
jgi:hypothetical protein